MICYRLANKNDWKAIAELHAKSWQNHYDAIYPKKYLKDDVLEDRLSVWRTRFASPNENMHLILAINENEIIGFTCIFSNHESGHGALLDNLHVLKTFQGQKIGLKLLQLSYDWVKEQSIPQALYLFALKDNIPAKKFYYRFGGIFREKDEIVLPNGEMAGIERISWESRPQ